MAKRRLESILALPDIHCPFEDKRAVRIVEDVAKAHKPNHIVISGDFLDGLNVSRHRKDPDLKVRFRDELDAGNALLDRIDALRPRGRKVFCAGNHESRLPNYIADNAPAFHGMLSIEGLLNLEKRGWEYVEYGDVAKIGKVRYTHDTGSAGAGAAQKSRTKVGGSTIIGHCHRVEITYSGTLAGGRHVAASFGWLGNQKYAKYMGQAGREHWQHGFGLGWMEPNGITHFQAVPIINYRCVVNGEVYG
jgi:hypothetical protein